VVEARAQYLVLAEVHTRANEPQKALEVLCQISDLDPQNVDIRIKLGEGYASEGMKAEAVASFAQAGDRLLSRGLVDRSLELYSRALKIDPADQVSLKGLLAAHTARGTSDEAVEVIERVSAQHEGDVDLLSLLAGAYIEAEEAFEAEQTTANIVSKEPSSYMKYLDVARLYLKLGKAADAMRVLGLVAGQALVEEEDARLLAIVEEALAGDADNTEALRLLVRVYWRQRATGKLEDALERLVESAQAAGLNGDERFALTQLNRLFPEMVQYIDRLKELGGPEENAADTLPDFAAPDAPPDIAQEETMAAANQFEDHYLSEIPSAAPPPVVLAPPPVADAPQEFSIEWNSLAESQESAARPGSEFSTGFEIGYESITGPEEPMDLAFAEPAEAVSGDDPRVAEIRARELESVDFYIARVTSTSPSTHLSYWRSSMALIRILSCGGFNSSRHHPSMGLWPT